jgi:multiple sugar transport system substrate-binding protein
VRRARGVRRPSLAATGTVTVAATVLALALAGCQGGSGGAEPGPTLHRSTATPTQPTSLDFGVYGPKQEVAAFQKVVDRFNAHSDTSRVRLRSWSTHQEMMADLRAGGDSASQLPDIFMVTRDDLAWLQREHLTQPVDELLDERGLDFGDGYSRDALEAFSADNRLQCMPYSISPMVMYYNTDLVDFTKMQARGLTAPDPTNESPRWSLEQFTASAEFAARPRRHTRGVYIDPTLNGLAPFIYSGGGQVFDDEDAPTSLAFSTDETRSALERTLQLLRNPHLTLTDKQLAKAPALRWFERGRLGMVAGYRSLVPELRKVPGLHFDVMPMPSLDSGATVGEITGLCMSSDAANRAEAADFLVHATATDSVSKVVRTGYLVPANLEVAASDDFRQPGRMPEHSLVFNTSVRALHLPPILDTYPQLEGAVSGSLHDLFTEPVLDLDATTTRIDEESRPVLAPDSASESPQ